MKAYTAVLHINSKNPMEVAQLGSKVSTGMAANKVVFVNPDPMLEVLDPEKEKLIKLLSEKDGSKVKNQEIKDQAAVVYALLKSELAYVNKVAQGDKMLILLSGFDCNNEPVTRSIPGKALIKRVEDGSLSCSAKIYVEALADADRYKVEITTTPTDPKSWKTVLDYGALNKIEIRDLARGEEIYIRVSGGNTLGWGIPSEQVSFIPR